MSEKCIITYKLTQCQFHPIESERMPLFSQKRAIEILDATRKLYETMSYREININEISKITSISRPSIYNYFQTKEEIFLVLLAKEYHVFAQKITEYMEQTPKASKDDLRVLLAQRLAEQPLMLKLLSNNIEDFEEFSRMEIIIYFKQAYSDLLSLIDKMLSQYLETWSKDRREAFIYAFFPYLFGIYVCTFGTEKQRLALAEVQSDFIFFTIYDLVDRLLVQLFKD